MPSLKDSEEIIATAKTFTPKQWAVILFLITSCVGTAFWVENRYAKIEEINQQFQKNQQQLDSAHFLTLEMFGLLTEAQRRQIMEKLNLSDRRK